MALHRRWKGIVHLYIPAFLSKQWCCFLNCTILSYLFCSKNYWRKRIEPALLTSVYPGSVLSALIFLSLPSCARRIGGPRSEEAPSAFFKQISKLGVELRSLARVYLTHKQDQWPPHLLLCLGFRCQLSFWSRSLPSSSCFGMWECKGSQLDCHLLWRTMPGRNLKQKQGKSLVSYVPWTAHDLGYFVEQTSQIRAHSNHSRH